MTQLALLSGVRLARPVGVDWFRQLQPAKLLNLRPGQFVWYIDREYIICAEVIQASARLDISSQPSVHGIQVFCSSKTKTWCPYLVKDKQPSPFYMITDREAAYEYYACDNADKDPPLKLVRRG